MNINIYNPYVREELYLMHHGIAGQKWGKRNGPPYPLSAGAHSASEKKAGWRKSLDKSSQATESGNSGGSDNAQKVAIDRIKKAKLYTEEDCHKANTPEGKRRNRENADLGLKALYLMGRDAGDPNNITNDDRSWFVYEDQTIGLFAIADLVNRGKTKQEIVSLINDTKKLDYDDIYNIHGAFQLSEAGNGTDVKAYIDACIDVKKGNYSTDNPKSEKTLAKELQFLGDIAGKWSRSDSNAAEINERATAFMNKISEKSIDWYEDEPKSERAKAWKKEKDEAFEKVEKTLGTKAKDAEKLYQSTRDKDYMWKFAGIESRKIKDLYEAYSKARKEYRDAEHAVKSLYDDKLVDVVLKDLGIPVTEENRKRIYASEVLFWD